MMRALLLVLAAAVMAPGLALAQVVAAVPWGGNENRPHEVYSGGKLMLQAVAFDPANGNPIALASGSWDPGDGSGPRNINVSDSLMLELEHTYSGALNQPFTATIRVTTPAGAVLTDTMKVVIKADTRDTRVNMAIDRGLWNLHKRTQRTMTDGLPSAYWRGYSNYHFAATAGVVQAFAINGHRSTNDPTRDPYAINVERGLRFVLGETHGRLQGFAIGLQNGNDPDSNGNGIGLAVSLADHTSYVTGQLIDALVANGTPNRVADTGQAGNVLGRTYRDIVQDLLDGYSWGMNDHVGGWHYNYNAGDNDTSASHWWAIGVLAAHIWDLDAPQWVKNIQWNVGVPRMQRWAPPSGCYFGYTGSWSSNWGDHQMNVTAAGLILMNADGIPQDDPRYTCAMGWIDTYFNAQLGNFYTMYQLAKAMRTAVRRNADGTLETAPITLLKGTRDWYAAYADHLVNTQAVTGAFSPTVGSISGYIQADMATSWAIIILSKSLFEQPPTAVCQADSIVCAAGATCGAAQVGTYSNANFDGSLSTPGDNPIAGYSWNFTDGTVVAGVNTVHAFQATGTYNVTLTVTDTKGNASTAVCPVQVTDKSLPPVANAGGPYATCLGFLDPVVIDGSASFGRGSNIVRYEWDFTAPVNFAEIDAVGATPGDMTAFFAGLGVGAHDIALRLTDDSNPPFVTTHFTTVTVRAARDPICDACPDDDAKRKPLVCGCGVAEDLGDGDGDGTANCLDACPADPNKTAIGVCDCGVPDTDTDGDGTADCLDECDGDAHKTEPGTCGCGVADTDGDGDGVADCEDNCVAAPNANQADADRDGRGDACDVCILDPEDDADGDSHCADDDNCPAASNVEQTDTDGDGFGDACDGDDDGDGDGDATDCRPLDAAVSHNAQEHCSDGIDNDCDGAIDGLDNQCDNDRDGIPNDTDPDDDNDGVPDDGEQICGSDPWVADNAAPAIECPADAIAVADATCHGTHFAAATVIDACEPTLQATDDGLGDAYPLGDTTVTYTVVDAGSSEVACTQRVTVVDESAPVADAGDDRAGLEADASCGVSVTVDGSASSDNCGIASYRWTEGDTVLGDTARLTTTLTGVGRHTLTLTVCDTSGTCTSDDVVVTIDASVMTCFAVSKVNLKLAPVQGKDGDHLFIDGTYGLNGCTDVAFGATGATFTADGRIYVVPAGGFAAVGGSGKYRYTSPRAGKSWWELEVDTKKGGWSFKAHHLDGAGLTPADGLDVTLVLGDQVGRDAVELWTRGNGGEWHDTIQGNPRTCGR